MGYWDHNDERNVDAISGACMMVRREAIDRIGLLDEKYFMYGEDIDWCYRIRRDGWEIRYFPKAEITHFAGNHPGFMRTLSWKTIDRCIDS